MGLYEEVQLHKQVKELNSLLLALLTHTGPVTLTPEEASKVYESGEIRSEGTHEGGMTLWLENPRIRSPEV